MKRIYLFNNRARLPIHIITIGLIILLFLASCCERRNSDIWFPHGALEHYNSHDRINFYCPESDTLESYMVCVRDTVLNIESYHANQFCEYHEFRHSLFYKLSLDSCGSSKNMLFWIGGMRASRIGVQILHPGNDEGAFGVYYNESTKFSIDILGHTYHNVIKIPGNEWWDIPSILFSYEYGVIHIQYENYSFSLVNDKN